ncbi:hypothetical protein NFI96_009243 [Prochilodus magdalenae]|nr:hypothetical protein NFI96_009243 [Prochilodus magdalenae]
MVVRKAGRLSVTLSCPLDLTLFPMDTQRCKMQLESFGYTTDDLQFMWQSGDPVQMDEIALPQFDIRQEDIEYGNCTKYYAGTGLRLLQLGQNRTENRPPTKTIQNNNVLWAPLSGHCSVGSVLWGSVLWAASCGQRPVGSVPGHCPLGSVLWAASCGQRPVGSVLCPLMKD